MGLIILAVVGSVLGWLASILLRRESRDAILATFAAGVAGALVGAIIVGGVPLLSGIGAAQLLWAVVGAAIAIALLTFAQSKSFQ